MNCWWECKLVQALWKTICRLIKIKTKTNVQFNNSSPGYLSKGNKNTNLKMYMYPYVHCTFVYNSQDIEATLVSVKE